MVRNLIFGNIMVPMHQKRMRSLSRKNKYYSTYCGNVIVPPTVEFSAVAWRLIAASLLSPLLEVLKKQINTEDGIYEIGENLWLIPADDGLDNAQEFLSGSGMGAIVLSKRLKEVSDLFQYCIIDAPPQRSQICLTSLGAADHIIIPVEASSKGVNSLIRTLSLVEELQEIDAFSGIVLGILPFRDKWVGNNQVAQSKASISAMRTIAEEIVVLPSILESEQFKKAIDKGVSLSSLGFEQLETPFQQIIERLQKNV